MLGRSGQVFEEVFWIMCKTGVLKVGGWAHKVSVRGFKFQRDFWSLWSTKLIKVVSCRMPK